MHNLITVDPSAAQTDPIAISIGPSLLTYQVISGIALAALALLATAAAVAVVAAPWLGLTALLVIPAGAKALLATLASIVAALALTQLGLSYKAYVAAKESVEANTIEAFNLRQRCAEQQIELQQAAANLQAARAEAAALRGGASRPIPADIQLQIDEAERRSADLIERNERAMENSQHAQARHSADLIERDERAQAALENAMQRHQQVIERNQQAVAGLLNRAVETHQRNTALEDELQRAENRATLAESRLRDAEQLSSALVAATSRGRLSSFFGATALGTSTLRASHLPAIAPADVENPLAQSIVQFAEAAPADQGNVILEALEWLGERQPDLTHVPLDERPPLLNWLGNGIAALQRVGSAAFTGLNGAVNQAYIVGQAVAKVIDANTEHNHVWKQKKYELAVKEFKAQFLAACPVQGNLAAFETELGKEVASLLLSLYTAATSADIDYRANYYQMVMRLRAIIASPEYQALSQAEVRSEEGIAILQLVRSLCCARYASVHMYAFCEQLVTDVIAAGAGHEQARIDESDFEAIKNAPVEWKGTELGKNIGKIKGHTNINFDPALYCNVPFVLGDMPLKYADGRQKNARLLRMGVPTVQSLGNWNKAVREWDFVHTEIDPIWKEFMQAQLAAGKCHLYISFQNDIPRAVLNGDESRRNRALKELAAENPNFIFVVLAQDSPFYHQTGIFGDAEMSASAFFGQFLEQLTGNSADTGFYFPAAWKEDPSFRENLTTMLLEMMHALYPDAAYLTIQERRNCIEIFEACLFLHMMVKTEADTVNGTCKDAIDRAMKTIAMVLEVSMIGQGQSGNPDLQRIQKTYAHAPAFMVKKQPMVTDRRKRLMAGLEALQPEMVQQRMANWLQSRQQFFGLIPESAFTVEQRAEQGF